MATGPQLYDFQFYQIAVFHSLVLYFLIFKIGVDQVCSLISVVGVIENVKVGKKFSLFAICLCLNEQINRN